MSTPDSVKYSNTPTATENVWGAGLKDAKRQSPSTALADVAQSVTGVILGIFLFCHMAFTSSVQISKMPRMTPVTDWATSARAVDGD